jgi:dipeptidyl aminopeptidase/acylaminoacyl peptidase
MKSDRRFEQDLPSLLDDLYVGPMPPYRDHVLHQTARTRQRPAWSIPGRWLPMVDIARQPVLVPRLPWRTIGLGLALLALLLGLIAALVVGGPPRLPAPFGLARNGLVAYASAGDIYTVDPVRGDSTAIVKGPGDTDPRWSRDGTRLAFTRQDVVSGTSLLYVVAADGSGLIQVTPQPLPAAEIETYTFSPDGKEILISASPDPFTHVLIAATDGSGIRQVDLPGRATDVAWRPPDGSEILFQDSGTDSNGSDSGIYAVNVQDGKVRTILAGADAAGRYRGHAAWSPDGSLISYGEWPGLTGIDVQTHVIAADGTGDRILSIPAGAVWQAPESWSNDGTHLLVIRGYTGDMTQSRPVAVPVAGSGFGIEIPYPGGIGTPDVSAWEWAPDDTSILGTPADASGNLLDQVLLDPVNGTSRTLPWASVSQPSWQRLAP